METQRKKKVLNIVLVMIIAVILDCYLLYLPSYQKEKAEKAERDGKLAQFAFICEYVKENEAAYEEFAQASIAAMETDKGSGDLKLPKEMRPLNDIVMKHMASCGCCIDSDGYPLVSFHEGYKDGSMIYIYYSENCDPDADDEETDDYAACYIGNNIKVVIYM